MSLTHSTIRAPLATCQNEFVSEYNFICMNTQYTVHYLTTLRYIMVHYKGLYNEATVVMQHTRVRRWAH